MTDFTHLHVHSHYSLLDGLNTPLELMQAAKDIGQNALASTEHGTLSSHRDFIRAAKSLDMKPILGLEAYISPTDRFDRRPVKDRADGTQNYHHIILLAQNETGLRNIHKMSEIAWTEGFYSKPRIDKGLLSENSEGVIVLSGCMNSIIAKAITNDRPEDADNITRWFKETLGDKFYMEIQPHNPVELNMGLLELADKYSIEPVVTSDCHYAREEDRWVEEALLILSTNPSRNKEADFQSSRKIGDIFERLRYLYPDRKISFEEIDVYVASRSDVQSKMEAQGITRTDIYENTQAIADSMDFPKFEHNLNLLPVPKTNPDERLKLVCEQGLAQRGFAGNEEYEIRLKEELEVILHKDFASYFLVVSDMVKWAKDNKIPVGPGRGSSAGSLVCYALRITEVDPIKYNLLFSRFISEDRADIPDVDIDFSDKRRHEVKEYLVRRFKNVASVSTFGTFAEKGVVRDAARVFGVPLSEVNPAMKKVHNFDGFQFSPETAGFRNEYPEVLDLARRLRGRIRSVGIHAGGIVVAKEPLRNFAPIETRKDPDSTVDERVPVVGYDLEEVADIGLIKIDALGLKTLSVIDDTIATVKARRNIDIDLLSLELNDSKVFGDLTAGFTKGVFQAEANAYTDLLMKMGVETFNDLVASNALVRPGAMDSIGQHYIKRKNGTERVEYSHDIIRNITSDTYGLVVYQEQVMAMCVELAGMSWADANKIRKIIGKKRDVKEFEQYQEMFVAGASKHIDKSEAEKLWHEFEAHANYSFNKSHAVAYSMLSYWTAYLKHYYALEFVYALLKNEKNVDKRTEYLIDARRLGVQILLPHVNTSNADFKLDSDGIRFGLGNIKFLSEKTAKKLIKARPFKSYSQLLAKAQIKNSGISTRMLEALNAVGAAHFEDNPKTGEEPNNYYEYLNIPKFDLRAIPPQILKQITPSDKFTEDGTYIMMGMPKNIKRGDGWARVDIVDESGSVGVFHDQHTPIETGRMYILLVNNNRISRFIEIGDKLDKSDPFVKFLMADSLEVSGGKNYVVDFSSRKTKAGKMMGYVVLAKADKDMRGAMIFPGEYRRALGAIKAGNLCEVVLARTKDDTLFVKEIIV